MLRELSEELRKFGSFVVQESRANLTEEGKANGALFNSLSYELSEPFKDVYDISFSAVDYANFVDQGVKGNDPSKVSPNAKITGQQAPSSPYRFGRGTYSGTWDSFQGKIRAWAKQKNIRLRKYKTVDGKRVATGQFEKGNYNSIAYIISKNIFNRGIAPTMFFTKPFEKAIEIYTPLFQSAFGEDIDELIRINVALQKRKK
tara:strand:- start:197 stop:802 length:606 start_codon:yes stop_codon:yes gene_type:complete